MGVSTDGILFYGYCWDEELDLFADVRSSDDDEQSWEQIILCKRGETNPWDAYPIEEIRAIKPYEKQQKVKDEWVESHRAEIDTWYAKEAAVCEEFDVAVGRHCSGECSMPYLYVVTAAVYRAYRGRPVKVESLAVDPAWGGKLDRFLAEFGIEKPQEFPQWWLVSYWG